MKFGLKPQKELERRLSDRLLPEGTADLTKVVAILIRRPHSTVGTTPFPS